MVKENNSNNNQFVLYDIYNKEPASNTNMKYPKILLLVTMNILSMMFFA